MSEQLLSTILSHSTGKDSRLHGPIHWAGVAAAGLTLLENTPEADPRIALLFAMLHDSMRESDFHDPEHGARAAKLARKLHAAGDLELDEGRLAVLEEALVYHDRGGTSSDPTIGVCWDADRLNLRRLYIAPKPALLSTAAGRRLTGHAARVFSGLVFAWPAIFASYEAEHTVYLRFGDLPPDGCSAVPYLGIPECGVSAYPGSKLEDGSFVLDFRRCLLGIDTRFLAWILKQARPLYLVEGRPAGIGGMGEPVLSSARIVCEVPPRSVDVLPDRPRFKALIEAWRARREGKDPGQTVFTVTKEPDERRLFPFVANTGESQSVGNFRDMVEAQLRSWGWDGLADEYRQQRQQRQGNTPGPGVLQQREKQPWEESYWT